MTDRLRIALAQINSHLGALDANAGRIRGARAEAAAAGADLVVTPEFSIAGYPPEDLILKPAFVEACEARIAALASETGDGGPGLVIGGPWREAGRLHNALFLLEGGRIAARRAKHELPNTGALDDRRVFASGPAPGPVSFRGVRLGLMIGEDWWLPEVPETLGESGAEILLSVNGSPFDTEKQDLRIQLAVARVVETGLPFAFVNQVGGQDELVFDGASFVLNADRSLAVQMPLFEERVTVTDWGRRAEGWACAPQPVPPAMLRVERIYRAMMLGLRDHVEKNGFPGILLGLSGGVDSALSAAVAVDALGPDRVHAVMMSSPHDGAGKLEDAEACARMLGIRCDSIGIARAMEAFGAMLKPLLGSHLPDATEKDLRSRIRGMALMALSDRLGAMLLATGNKSEMGTGHGTPYGAMYGGYSVLKDVYRTTVFELSRWRNAGRPQGALGPEGAVMPERGITRAASAELRPGRTDQDILPPYPVLDAILEGLVEREQGVDALVEAGHDRATVLGVWRMLDRAEYKRRQAPPGVKITPRAFGRDRRYPITNGFTGLIQ